MEGTRVLLVEVQALLSPSPYAAPRRQVTGADPRRVVMLAAVLDQRCKLKVAASDIFVNVVGGVKVEEPGIDLAISTAMASALKGKPLPMDMVIFGEVGLTGEVRPVRQVEQRLNEARRLGFRTAMIPSDGRKARSPSGLELSRVKTLRQALDGLL
jgi:DNA repair protein RadA/Sms